MQIEKHNDDTAATGPRKTIRERDLLTLVLGEDDKLYWFTGSTNPEINVTDFSTSGIRKILMTKKAEIKGLHIFIKASDPSRYRNLVDNS